MRDIVIHNAYEKNLKNVSVSIPRNQLVVFSGVSGSGKSTLLIDVLYQECQRQHLEAISFQGINKAKVDLVENAGACILIGQEEYNQNPRSTLGTMSDIYTELRMLYEKLGVRECPYCHKMMDYAICQEELIKDGNDFIVYMYCPHCHTRMEKLTRSHFSFNTQEGACPTCAGLGEVYDLDVDALLCFDKTLQEGAIRGWQKKYNAFQIEKLVKACNEIGIKVEQDVALKKLDPQILHYLIEGLGDFEGIKTNFQRRYQQSKKEDDLYHEVFHYVTCPSCHGDKLKEESCKVLVNKVSLPTLNAYSIEQLYDWIIGVRQSLQSVQEEAVMQYLHNLEVKLEALQRMGLGYLTLDRQSRTLSRGEKQRIKLSAALQSSLVGMIYILDEPTVGLHPKDTQGIIKTLQQLRDRGNSVLVIEHDEDMIKSADYLIEMGQDAGDYGGTIIAQGTLAQVMNNVHSYTAEYLKKEITLKEGKDTFASFYLRHAMANNIKDIDVTFKKNALNVVTGVSGVGKSTLLFQCLTKHFKQTNTQKNCVENVADFDALISVDQKHVSVQKRSVVATYCNVYEAIRKLFAQTSQAKERKWDASYFSFNTSSKGRCERCEGLGEITSSMLFFKDVTTTCPQCHGKRFKKEILEVQYHGYSIDDVLHLSIEDALQLFRKHKSIYEPLYMMKEIGLQYLRLNQLMTTLSTGEKQRMKLAMELLQHKKSHCLYVLDEPTTGLHAHDVAQLLLLFAQIVQRGNTLLIIEHNLQVIRESDYIIDMGTKGGIHGGHVVACGTLQQIKENKRASLYGFL